MARVSKFLLQRLQIYEKTLFLGGGGWGGGRGERGYGGGGRGLGK